MEVGGEEESVGGFLVDLRDILCIGGCQAWWGGLYGGEYVCCARDGGLCSIAMFGHQKQGRGDEGGGSADVVCPMRGTTCSDDITLAIYVRLSRLLEQENVPARHDMFPL